MDLSLNGIGGRQGNTIPSGHIFRCRVDGMDKDGLSAGDYLSIDPALRSIFFSAPDTKRTDADIVTLALASVSLNIGTMIGTMEKGVLLYPYGTGRIILNGALRSFGLPSVPVCVSSMFLGQSEIVSIFNTGSFYNDLDTAPVPEDGNVLVFTRSGGVTTKTTVATPATIYTMAAMSAFLNYVAPGIVFRIGCAAVSGTSRYQLADDAQTSRNFTDVEALVSAIELETGAPLDVMVECWYNSDATSISTFSQSFWPLYFGCNASGSEFTLGTVNANAVDTSSIFNNCFFDGVAALGEWGRGIFSRGRTDWHILTPMPFYDSPIFPAAELGYFTQTNARLSEPSRDVIDGLLGNTLAQSVSLTVGPSAHLCRFGGTDSQIHPDPSTSDGQLMFMWPFAIALLKKAGVAILEPTITDITGPEDGTYADLIVSLPNGGTLTTLKSIKSYSDPAVEPPHYQPVVGIEISRGSVRHPVYKTAETSYAVEYRGVVSIVDSGSGSPRTGRVRITPVTPFSYGNGLSYLRGQATAVLLEERDITALLYRNFLIEHIPSLYDTGALYPFPGVAVKPYQNNLIAPVPEPAFTPQSSRFNGTSSFLQATGLSVTGSYEGIVSSWFYLDAGFFSGTTIIDIRNSAGSQLYSLGGGGVSRLASRMFPLAATNTNTGLSIEAWHHVVISWKANQAGSFYCIYIDDILQPTTDLSSTAILMHDTVGRIYIGKLGNNTAFWPGSLGHIYVNTQQSIDLTIENNRRKFLSVDGNPVYLGTNGELPTGNSPAFYLDGGAAVQNFGTGGALAAINVTAGVAPLLP